MKRITLALILFSIMLSGAQPAEKPSPFSPPQSKAKPEKKEKQSSLTGCVDQKDSTYVLREEKMMKQLAALEPVGFKPEGFAKYMGHKVTVYGQMKTEADTPVMKVRRVQNVADTCAPAEQQHAKGK
jgi:hypothetical protein